jgi:hypothetical protein
MSPGPDNVIGGGDDLTVTLDAFGNALTNPMTTGDDPSTVPVELGWYGFKDLTPGLYYVVFSNLPANYIFTAPYATTDNNTDNNSDTDATGTSPLITLSPGENNETVDAGIWYPATIGNLIWIDINDDGIYDADGVDNIASNADDEV